MGSMLGIIYMIKASKWNNELVEDVKPIDTAITDDVLDDNHGDDWEAKSAVTDSNNDLDEDEDKREA